MFAYWGAIFLDCFPVKAITSIFVKVNKNTKYEEKTKVNVYIRNNKIVISHSYLDLFSVN